MSLPTVSVVMPCFNAERYIGNGTASALGQTYKNLELIVVDDGSTDGSQGILEKIQDSRLMVLRQVNRGVSAARNAGLQRAGGRYVAFLDADDAWDPRCLEKLIRTLEAAPRTALAYCGWQKVGLAGGKGKPYIPPDYEGERKLEYLLAGCPWPIHAALTRRDAVEAAGGFDKDFTNSEDYGLWLRIAAFHPIVRVPEVLAYYNFHAGEQASRNRAKAARYQWLAQHKFLKEHPEVVERVGRQRARELTLRGLLAMGYDFFWKRQLPWARETFRLVLLSGGWRVRDLPRLLPALLPLAVYTKLIGVLDRRSAKTSTTPESDPGLEA
jgi:glycosyltransferase involved in cell wall biosynthesis